MSESKKWITVWTDWSKPDTPKQFIECSDIEAVVLEVIKAERIAEANRETLRRVAEKQAEVDQPRDPMSDFAYVRQTAGPSKRKRREMAKRGEAWCSGCQSWLARATVRQGKCRPCWNAYARNHKELIEAIK